MHMDPIMLTLVGSAFVILIIGFILKKLKQPYVIGYLVAGILIGPFGLAILTNQDTMSKLGTIGVLLLLFFVGMEISLPKLVDNWRVMVIGTTLQILLSVGLVWLIGIFFDWSFSRVLLLGFVISLSSTSVVLKILQEWKEINTDAGQDVLGILLAQDLAIVPMLIIIGILSGDSFSYARFSTQLAGGILIAILFVFLIRKKEFRFPFPSLWKGDHEIEVFSAAVLFLGIAFLTGLFQLSAALGAFIAGILISIAKETQWVQKSLEPFYTVFVALFFLSIGMLMDIRFFLQNWLVILLLVLTVLLSNTFINAVILRGLKINWRRSLYSGAMLAQIGEFSFVLATVGYQAHIITEFVLQITIIIISLTMLLSPVWILLFKKITRIQTSNVVL